VNLERLTSTRRATGPLFCPRCCWRLGRAESPAIGYLKRCGGCRRSLRVIEMAEGDVAVIVADDRSTIDCVFVELDEHHE
jgi:hypothetical protein